ncbi:MAG: hypothetical protein ACJAY7_001108 [Pseudohongiellaceae bacterium]|jgi:hypothetical protein
MSLPKLKQLKIPLGYIAKVYQLGALYECVSFRNLIKAQSADDLTSAVASTLLSPFRESI